LLVDHRGKIKDMRAFVVGLVLIIVMSNAAVASLPSATQIIQKEGQFAFTDGSSYYLFRKDKTFSSGPMGLSGRTISGHWVGQGDDFIIDGHWGWINGLSALHDFRRMTLSAHPEGVEAEGKSRIISGMGISAKLYRCYFVIDELVGVPQPKQRGTLPQ